MEQLFLKAKPHIKLKIAVLLIFSAIVDVIANIVIWMVGGRKRP